MSSNGRIVDEAGYQKSLEWMVMKAAELDDPLLDPAERSKLAKTYDFVEQRLLEYRRGELVQMFPGLREQYKILGLYVQEMTPQQSEPEPASATQPETDINAQAAPESQPGEPAVKPAPKQKRILSGWLDD